MNIFGLPARLQHLDPTIDDPQLAMRHHRHQDAVGVTVVLQGRHLQYVIYLTDRKVVIYLNLQVNLFEADMQVVPVPVPASPVPQLQCSVKSCVVEDIGFVALFVAHVVVLGVLFRWHL